jgi:hypothetical protein
MIAWCRFGLVFVGVLNNFRLNQGLCRRWVFEMAVFPSV